MMEMWDTLIVVSDFNFSLAASFLTFWFLQTRYVEE